MEKTVLRPKRDSLVRRGDSPVNQTNYWFCLYTGVNLIPVTPIEFFIRIQRTSTSEWICSWKVNPLCYIIEKEFGEPWPNERWTLVFKRVNLRKQRYIPRYLKTKCYPVSSATVHYEDDVIDLRPFNVFSVKSDVLSRHVHCLNSIWLRNLSSSLNWWRSVKSWTR